MAELHRLSSNQLQLNEPLPWDVFDQSNQLLLRKGYVIQRDSQIERLLANGMFVDAEIYKAYFDSHFKPLKQASDPIAMWKEIQGGIGALCLKPPQDASLCQRVQGLAQQVIELCAKSAELALAAISLQEYRRYPFAHSLHVAVLCELLARRGDFDDDAHQSLVCAALTENIAMCELQQMLYHQKTPLTPEQRQAINEHPMAGARLLQSCGVEDQEWLRAVLEHHETSEGQGYPRHVHNPSMLALLIHTCDVYAAEISGRAYRKPLLAPDAAKKLYLEHANGKENPFVGLLIKEIGMYPPGTCVRLANGEVGVVSARSPEHNNMPIVAVLISAKGLRYMDPVRRNTGNTPELKIVSVLSNDGNMMAIDFEKIWSRKN